VTADVTVLTTFPGVGETDDSGQDAAEHARLEQPRGEDLQGKTRWSRS
jgi:hypothetical protein